MTEDLPGRVTEGLRGRGFRLRRAVPADVAFLSALARDERVEPFLAAVSPWAEDTLPAEIERSQAEPREHGRFVLEFEEGGESRSAGALAFEVSNRRSRIAHLFGVMLHPGFRRRGLGEAATRLLACHLIRDLGYHRVQLEVYGFNEPALRLFERAGFVREGARRRAYWRHGGWTDGVLFGLLEDLEWGEPADAPRGTEEPAVVSSEREAGPQRGRRRRR